VTAGGDEDGDEAMAAARARAAASAWIPLLQRRMQRDQAKFASAKARACSPR